MKNHSPIVVENVVGNSVISLKQYVLTAKETTLYKKFVRNTKKNLKLE